MWHGLNSFFACAVFVCDCVLLLLRVPFVSDILCDAGFLLVFDDLLRL